MQKTTNIFHSAHTESECSSDYVIKMCDFVYLCTPICTFFLQKRKHLLQKNTIFSGYLNLPAPLCFAKGHERVKVVEHSALKSSFVANKHPRRSKNMFFDEWKLPCTLPDSMSSPSKRRRHCL
jgi:hypothetical protein